MMIVSLEEASRHLRRDTLADDADLELKIKAASAAVLRYISNEPYQDSFGEIPEDSNGILIGIPDDVKIATLMLVGIYYVVRTGEAGIINPQFSYGFLPDSVVAMLFPYRLPTLS